MREYLGYHLLFCKVSIERVNDRVFSLVFQRLLCPIVRYRSTSIGENSRIFKFLKVSINPSLSAVNLTCSEPGLIPKIAFGFTFCYRIFYNRSSR